MTEQLPGMVVGVRGAVSENQAQPGGVVSTRDDVCRTGFRGVR